MLRKNYRKNYAYFFFFFFRTRLLQNEKCQQLIFVSEIPRHITTKHLCPKFILKRVRYLVYLSLYHATFSKVSFTSKISLTSTTYRNLCKQFAQIEKRIKKVLINTH